MTTYSYLILDLIDIAKTSHHKKKRWAVRAIFQKRQIHGAFHTLFKELLDGDEELFFEYTRMNPSTFRNRRAPIYPSNERY
jgi:hypothetical protein